MRNIHTKIISLNRWHVGACCLCLRLLTFTVGAPTPLTPFNTPWRRWREGEWKSDPSAFNESQWNLYICIDQRRRICHKKGGKKTASPDSKLCCKIHHFSVKFIPVNWVKPTQSASQMKASVCTTWPQHPQTCPWGVVVLLLSEDLVAFFLSPHVLNHHGTVWVHGLRLKIKKSRVTHEIIQQCSNDDSGRPHWCVVSVYTDDDTRSQQESQECQRQITEKTISYYKLNLTPLQVFYTTRSSTVHYFGWCDFFSLFWCFAKKNHLYLVLFSH